MAAMAKHAGTMVRAKLFIEVSLLFLWTVVINPPRHALFRCRTKSAAPHPEQADHAKDP